MIALSPEAEAQLDALIAHYEALSRVDASINLLNALERARTRIFERPEAGLPAPRPYRLLRRLAVAGSSKAAIGFLTARLPHRSSLAFSTRCRTFPTVTSDRLATAWRTMASVPKDGTRVLAVIRGTEQGPANVDVVRWTLHKRDAEPCWVSTDSSADCAIVYDDWEVAFWMPLPSSIAPVRTPGLAAQLPEFPRDGLEIGGSGI